MGSGEEGVLLVIQGPRLMEALQSSAVSFQGHCGGFLYQLAGGIQHYEASIGDFMSWPWKRHTSLLLTPSS